MTPWTAIPTMLVCSGTISTTCLQHLESPSVGDQPCAFSTHTTHVCVCVCVCVHMHVCMCVCVVWFTSYHDVIAQVVRYSCTLAIEETCGGE